ncbi:MAG TPA: hypothetical protein PKC30_06835 [Saprospiraceae bacterium]|nr:hypothetical protein [Saprospiraceae bacterium]
MKKEHHQKGKRKDATHMKYIGFAFQLFLTMAIAGYLGGQLDKVAGWDKTYLTAIFIILVFLGFMIKLLKEL